MPAEAACARRIDNFPAVKRLLSKASAFDFIVSIMLGLTTSRAINGSAPFVPTLVPGARLLCLPWLLGLIAFRTEWFGSLGKGGRVLLIDDGQVQHEGVRRAFITEEDLEQALRLHTKRFDPAKVERADLKRNREAARGDGVERVGGERRADGADRTSLTRRGGADVASEQDDT